MKIFISQPMRGKSNEQIRKERDDVIKFIESNGDTVIDSIIAEETLNITTGCVVSWSIYSIVGTIRWCILHGWAERSPWMFH